MEYLTVELSSSEGDSLVTPSLEFAYLVVKIDTSIVKESDAYTDAIQKIYDAVGFYTSSIADLGVALGKTVLEKAQELHNGLQGLEKDVETASNVSATIPSGSRWYSFKSLVELLS
jgi:hypothetical protein